MRAIRSLLARRRRSGTRPCDQISTGPVGTGPDAPFDELQAADQLNANDQGFSCDPMCIAGDWENTPAADK